MTRGFVNFFTRHSVARPVKNGGGANSVLHAHKKRPHQDFQPLTSHVKSWKKCSCEMVISGFQLFQVPSRAITFGPNMTPEAISEYLILLFFGMASINIEVGSIYHSHHVRSSQDYVMHTPFYIPSCKPATDF